MSATTPRTKNLYNKMEWAGAFGDVGTLIPFVVAYITIVKVNPLGLLLMFGLALIASGVYYRTPLPIQPMKAIGAAAVAGGISPAALFGSGLTTGLFWLLAGVTGAIRPISRLATKPIVHGIMLGLAPAGWPGTFASGRRICSLLFLKIVSDPQFHPIIVLFFAEFGVSHACDQCRPETQFPIGEAGIEQLRRQGITPIVQVHDPGQGRGEIEDIERLFLAETHVQIIFPGARPAVGAVRQALGAGQGGGFSRGLVEIVSI